MVVPEPRVEVKGESEKVPEEGKFEDSKSRDCFHSSYSPMFNLDRTVLQNTGNIDNGQVIFVGKEDL